MTDDALKAKEYLNRLEGLHWRERYLTDAIRNIDTMIDTLQWTINQAAQYSDARGSCTERIKLLQADRAGRKRERSDCLREMRSYIHELETLDCEDQYKTILLRHYADGAGLDVIADEIGYSHRQTVRLHEKALNIFWKEHCRREDC